MRLFAALYGNAALLLILLRGGSWDPIPWAAVCISAALLAGAAVARKHLVMLCAAHAGLTATWAGTLAAGIAKKGYASTMDASTLGMLLGLCAGMAVLIAAGLNAQPAPVKVKSSRP